MGGALTAALPHRGDYLIRGAFVLSMDDAVGVLPAADVRLVDGWIAEVGTGLDVADAEVIDADRMIAIPGFVATHEHLWAGLFKGVAGDLPPRDSWTTKELLGPHMTPEDTEASVTLACAEALNGGVTTAISWSHNWISPEVADGDLRGLVRSGIRARFAPGAPSTKWGLSLDEMDAVMARVGRRVDQPMDLDDLARIRRDWFDAGRVDGRIRLGVSVRGPSRSTPSVVRTEFDGARALGLPLYMHCAGTLAEVRRIRQVEVLDDAGLLGPDLGLAHGLHLSADEMRLMADHGVTLAVTPLSELRLELGMPPLTELRSHGVATIGLGFDNPAYAGTMDMFATMRVALGLERTRQGDASALGPMDVLRMATIEGARYLGLDDVAGSLTPGKRADLVLVRRDDLNMAPAGDPAAALVYSAQPSNVDTVVVDGRILKRAGVLQGFDVSTIVADATAALHRLCERAGRPDLLAP